MHLAPSPDRVAVDGMETCAPALPDLSRLTISPTPEESLLLSTSSSEPCTPSVSPPPITSPAPRRRYVRVRGQREPVLVSSVTVNVNVNVHATTAPVHINTGQGEPRAAPSFTPPHGEAGIQTPSSEGELPRPSAVPSTMRNEDEPAYTIRGGGKVIAWDPSREYVAPADPKHRRKWYVVIAGLRVGIWKSWLEMEGYVDVGGSRYQSCDTRDEAERIYSSAQKDGRVRLLIR